MTHVEFLQNHKTISVTGSIMQKVMLAGMKCSDKIILVDGIYHALTLARSNVIGELFDFLIKK